MLLAKSRRNGVEKTLLQHTMDVVQAGEILFGDSNAPTRLGRSWMHFFQLEPSSYKTFQKHLRFAALAHDLGKANSGFQAAVEGDRDSQVYRHEHLSGLILSMNSVEESFLKNSMDWLLITAAVIGHHTKSGFDKFGEKLTERYFTISTQEQDFQSILNELMPEKALMDRTIAEIGKIQREKCYRVQFDALRVKLNRAKPKIKRDEPRKRLLAAVRTALIVADSVGSASVRIDSDIKSWIESRFDQPLTPDDIESQIIVPRIEHLRAKGRWNAASGLSGFQEKIAEQPHRVLLTAPCGSGKTLAAWNWIKATLEKSSRPLSRALFLYPTRATATEGFRDYVSWAPESDAGFLTGTSEYELQEMFQNPEEEIRGQKNFSADPRLFSLGYWGKRVFSATADQFFPFLQYQYGPLCLTPLLAEAVLVVDEVHSYDNSMFNTLRYFLNNFPHVPVLCMTATLGRDRREILIDECGLKPFPEVPPEDLQEISERPRYNIQWIDRETALEMAKLKLDEQKRILWVANQVAVCQTVYSEFDSNDSTDTYSPKVFCYHARFKLKDRNERHKELVEAFQTEKYSKNPKGVLGITTQVCEMSLDLDAEFLFTELAPVESLIQRMGRCNRDSQRMRADEPGQVFVIKPTEGNEKPYEKDDLAKAEQFVNDLIGLGRTISQSELESTFLKMEPNRDDLEKLIPFESSGPFAQGREESFRDIDGFSVQCVLDGDVGEVKRLIKSHKPIDGFIVPAPNYIAGYLDGLPGWLRVVSSHDYCPLAGYKTPKFKPIVGGSDSHGQVEIV